MGKKLRLVVVIGGGSWVIVFVKIFCNMKESVNWFVWNEEIV